MHPLTLLILLPVLGAIVVALLPTAPRTSKFIALAVSGLTLAYGIGSLLPVFLPNQPGFQFDEHFYWFPSLGITYHLGIDGIALWLVLLTALLSFVATAFSWYVDKLPRYFMAIILLLEGAMIGAFCSLDLVFFFTFFEMTLVPMWLMIAFWGGERRAQAANKFLIYTFAGSILLLVGLVAVALRAQAVLGHLTFDVVELQSAVAGGRLWAGALPLEATLFWAFAAAFLVKSPVFPFHTWVPDTYGESPTAGPILSGAMVKLGSFGFLRFCLPLFPDTARAEAWILAVLAVIGIVYAAIIATVQTDARRMLAYSSISHMGFVILGIFSLNETGMVGGAYQQLNHGVISCLLFLLVGYLYQRRGTAEFKDFGGLKAQMPMLASLFLVAVLAGLGLPGTNGFVGEFLALVGIYSSGYTNLYGMSTGIAIAAAGSVIITAGYMLYMFQRLFYGPNSNPVNRRLRDLKPWEAALGGSLVALILIGGFGSRVFTESLETSIVTVQQMVVQPDGRRPTWSRRETTDRLASGRNGTVEAG